MKTKQKSELSYEDLEGVQNGMDAVTVYRRVLSNGYNERDKESLLEYCKLDTLALVYLWYALRGEAYRIAK